jgi:hypothetical protein
MIIFSEKDHKYTHLESGKELKGWTSLIKNFSKDFNRDAQLECSAYKLLLGNEEYNRLIQGRFNRLFCLDPTEVSPYLRSCVVGDTTTLKNELSYEWDYSGILGSKFHREQELLSYERGWEINPFDGEKYDVIQVLKEYDNQSAADCLYELQDGYYPELLVWDYTMDQSETPVTMIDRCFLFTAKDTGIRYCDIDDYKSNSKTPFNGKCDFMLPPFDKIHDNTLEKYKLQVQFGGKLLETHGFTVRKCAFTHYKNYDITKSKMYPSEYNKELMDLLQIEYKSWVNQDS